MTREEIIKRLENYIPWADEYEVDIEVLTGALELLKKEPCGDAISRQEVIDGLASIAKAKAKSDAQKSLIGRVMFFTEHLPSVIPQEPKTGHCKDCKSFEYDSVARVDGVPLIVAHEICNRWGDGCKTREDGYCFLFEPQESDHKCHTCKHYTSGENDGSCGSYICKNYSDWESEDKE